jgi:four helix bundle protein
MTPEPQLDYERLDVYRLARELAREGNAIMRQLPTGRADLIDQFRRASLSLPLNIAEGAGEFAPREKARFYRIAKRSGTECGAVLDHMVDLDLLPFSRTEPARLLIRRITGALVKLIHSTDRRPAQETASPRAPTPAPERVRAPGAFPYP